MKRMVLWYLAGLAVMALGGCVDRQAQMQSKATEKVVSDPIKAVSVVSPKVQSVSETCEITGDVTAGEDTTIGSKQNNRVVAVYVKDGDTVSAGQLLASMDDTSALAQLRQAQAQVATALAAMLSAKAQVAQATRNLIVGPHRSTVGVLMAQAQVTGAKRSYDKEVVGARPEEIAEAQANVTSAKANLDLQQKQLERTKMLVQQGALAGQNLDQQQAATDQAQAQFKSAQEALKLLQEGNRQEDIDSAKASMQSAEDSLKNAEDQKKLDPLLKDQLDAANAQMDSSRAQLTSARAQIQIANQAVADTKVFAPFAGKVSGKPIQAGTVAGADTAIVRIVGGAGIYFNGQITSENIDKVHVNDLVSIHVDGLPDKVFNGRIVGVNPLADTVGRLFSVRVQFTGQIGALKAGMFARGSVAIRTIPDAVVIPNATIVARGDKRVVYVVEGDKAKEVPVTIGLPTGDSTQVIGLPASSQVISEGQDTLTDGAKVKIKAAITALSAIPNPQSEGRG